MNLRILPLKTDKIFLKLWCDYILLLIAINNGSRLMKKSALLITNALFETLITNQSQNIYETSSHKDFGKLDHSGS